MLKDKAILITGGTGSFGKKLTEILLRDHKPRKIIIFSRDEMKQWKMQQTYPASRYPCMRYFVGDVRDLDRLSLAFMGVDIVIHAAALKIVPTAEYNPFEAVRTNITGSQNVITAAIARDVEKVLALSTDKAVSPANLYGATKLCMEKLFIAGNSYVGSQRLRLAVVRYGNVVGSRGSVVPLFLKMRRKGVLTITDPRMTRFWITLEQSVRFVISCLANMSGGEVFVPKLPSMNIQDLAQGLAPECRTEVIGIRPGEKLHELLISRDEARNTLEQGDRFLIRPSFEYFAGPAETPAGTPVPEDFEYSSGSNAWQLRHEDLAELARNLVLDDDAR
ncbi:UDP-N-acetylglucosamine 4,6-dehydratase (inverting) [Solidesulfovibrio magneticus]|uniref:UDP-N-acetylglucosamine dehydratase/epimerase n=1 Tax=Solidesulfovibrio magneticus (strain ATCC 700980 / DSM 13731 / RS-1) TaxID=573370 RepID=C4XP17_SOLM1|nr:UDP-N-acetylglucosamine 4,6-dehydratase (inverting) [Solidesulfovibrio magneticus]BAH77518.1 UDP-N-acetylglucosamine dehydratase/epimerase [Solidesulfovibrio magneticus RS-1]